MIRETIETPVSQNPSEEGWIALAPVHLFPWAILAVRFLQDLSFALFSRFDGGYLDIRLGIDIWLAVSLGGAILVWGIGAFAVAAALGEPASHPTRRWAMGVAAGLLALQMAESLARRFIPGFQLPMSLHWILLAVRVLLAAVALIALLRVRDQDSGGPFDAAVTTLAFAAGLDWIGLPLLAIGALGGHPLLPPILQALRRPSEALRRGWFDAQDTGLRLSRLSLGALLCSLAFLALLALIAYRFAYSSLLGLYRWWTWIDLLAVVLASLILAFHVLRQTRRLGLNGGRGLAISSLLISGLPLLLILIAAIILVLILTGLIPFRLF